MVSELARTALKQVKITDCLWYGQINGLESTKASAAKTVTQFSWFEEEKILNDIHYGKQTRNEY